jgi:transcriptional regulator with XRE-family HTH domain/tetratricopeptide (TPR) repeat protein
MKPDDVSPWGTVLTVLRVSRGWSQKQLAAAAGIKPDVVSDYERQGQKRPPDRLQALNAVMGYPPQAIDRTVAFLTGLAASLQLAAGGQSQLDLTAQVDALAGEIGQSWQELARDTVSRILRDGMALDARRRAATLWARLQPLSPAEQRAVVDTGEEFRSWALCELICEESVRAAADRASRALDLSGLALAVARRCDIGMRSAIEGYAWAFVGNARRVANDLVAADRAFARSHQLWSAAAAATSGVPWETMAGLLDGSRLLELEASLRRAQRRLPEALALLDLALAASQRPERRVRLLIITAKTLEETRDFAGAVELLRQAAPLVEEQADPRLRLAVRLNLIAGLCDLGRAEDASPLVAEARTLAVNLGNELDLVRLRWIEGKVAAGLGRLDEALAAFDDARHDFVARELPYDAALLTLELAQLLAKAGRTAAVKTLARESAAVFATLQVPPEAQRALGVFLEAAEAERLSVEVAGRLAAWFCRARREPHLRFDPLA